MEGSLIEVEGSGSGCWQVVFSGICPNFGNPRLQVHKVEQTDAVLYMRVAVSKLTHEGHAFEDYLALYNSRFLL